MKAGKVIQLPLECKESSSALIASKPWEFRKPPWESPHFIQILKSRSADLKDKFGKCNMRGIGSLLQGGLEYTILAMCALKKDEMKMREAYFLTGLIDCMINQVNPVLRTDIIRTMYKRVFELKKELNVHWYGHLDAVLLPIDARFFDADAYRISLNRAETMRGIFKAVREGTEEMFNVISSKYVFYCPRCRG
jgi:hypothetical protein